MQQQTKILLLFMFLWLVQKAQGQNNGKRAEQTILKVNKDRNPYTPSQTQWLVKNGFEEADYDWGDYSINEQLKGVFDQKAGVEVWRVIAIASGALAIKQYATDKGGRGFFLTFALTSGVISQMKLDKTRKRIQQINIWKKHLPSGDSIDKRQLSIDDDFHLNSPYKPSQNKYLKENGFDIHQYNWQNQEINKNLQRAFSNRTTGHTLLIAAVPTTIIGLLANLVHALSEDPDKPDKSPGTGFFIASGGLLTGSLILTRTARSKVKNAEKLRLKIK